MADIALLSADDLMTELIRHGLKVGPITPTTRKLFENKLLKARSQEKQVPRCEEICVLSPTIENNHTNGGIPISCENIDETSKNTTLFHYGVCFERCHTDGSREGEPTVFSSKEQALQAVKQLKDKGARFKPFKTRQEAERFSLSSVSIAPSSPGPVQKPVDPVGSFKKPTPQELVQFRKIIESGNFHEFLSIVNNNPRYLISSGDTPVILQEGFRYNALHVAAKENKTGICKLIVDTVESDRFWTSYLSLQKYASLSPLNHRRKQFLADLYLNTPDKGNFETPLHFACKFGHVDVVRYLLSHPLTYVTPENKYGETPEQIICSRCSSKTGSVKIMEEIKHILEDSYYVPVFGSEGDASPPSIGEPWSPDVHNHHYKPSSSSFSPVYPKMTVRSYAGPMSPSKAAEFYHQWKTPPKSLEEKRKYENIRRSDSTRGLERIGRNLAHAQNIPWTEYWGFLGTYADFAKPSGLRCLEDYFNKQFSRANTSDEKQELRPKSSICTAPSYNHLTTYCTPEKPSNKSRNVNVEYGENGESDYLNSNHNYLPLQTEESLINVRCQTSPETSVNKTSDKLIKCSLETSSSWNQTYSLPLLNHNLNDVELQENLKQQIQESQLSPSLILHNNSLYPNDDNKLFSCKKNLLDQLKNMSIEDDATSSDATNIEEESAVPKENQYHQQQQQLSDKFQMSLERKSRAENGDERCYKRQAWPLFINGFYPSKTDLDVLRALDGVSISHDTYPFIAEWHDRVTSYTLTARESWPSPGSPLCRSRQKSMF